MKRRNFIKFTAISTLFFSSSSSFSKTIPKQTLKVLDEVYEIIFPKTSNMPSAREFKAVRYLTLNLFHKSFDDEDKSLILQGSVDFIESFPDFLTLNSSQKKELIFSVIEHNEYAKSWISKLSYYGIEAMFSDPIYGGNFEKIAWSSINHSIGYPQPKKKYGQKL